MSKANSSYKSLKTKAPINLKELERYFQLEFRKDNFLDNVIGLITEVEFEQANTWLLKRYIEEGNKLPTEKQLRILDLLSSVVHWEARLHLLQILSHLTIPKSKSSKTRDVLLKLIQENNKFIRAWAYNGLYHLQTCQPEYKTEVISLLNRVYQNEAPSVKARIRNILRKDEWQI